MSALSPAMLRAVDAIKANGKIEAECRNGFNSFARWMDSEGPPIREITLDALVKRGVLKIEAEYSYHGHGEWMDHQVYVLTDPSSAPAIESK